MWELADLSYPDWLDRLERDVESIAAEQDVDGIERRHTEWWRGRAHVVTGHEPATGTLLEDVLVSRIASDTPQSISALQFVRSREGARQAAGYIVDMLAKPF